MAQLKYTPTERIAIKQPVSRITYMVEACRDKKVLDLGCYDETAISKENTDTYLFDQITKVAALHIGVDNSNLLPDDGLAINDITRIVKGNIYELDKLDLGNENFDVIIAGELIEHLPNTLEFFERLKTQFKGKRLICSTPNATSFSNLLLSFFKRESTHIDHLQVYSFKTLNTLCRMAGFENWEIIPYHVKFTEMILAARSIKKLVVKSSEYIVNGIECIFPLTGGGYIIDITL